MREENRKVNKKKLSEYIAESANISQKKAKTVLNKILSLIKEELVDSKKSSLPQIGSFIVKEMKRRR